jgi:hypothetical protein
LTVNNLTVLDQEIIPVDPLTAGFCQFDVPAVFPTIQEAINAAEASGGLTATVNVCGGVYTEDLTTTGAVAIAIQTFGLVLLTGNVLFSGPAPGVLSSAGTLRLTGTVTFDGTGGGQLQNVGIEGPGGTVPLRMINGASPSLVNVGVDGVDVQALFVDSTSRIRVHGGDFSTRSVTLPAIELEAGADVDITGAEITNNTLDGPALLWAPLVAPPGPQTNTFIGCTFTGPIVNEAPGNTLIVSSCIVRPESSGPPTAHLIRAGNVAGTSDGNIEIYNSHIASEIAGGGGPFWGIISGGSLLQFSQLSHGSATDPKVELGVGAGLGSVIDTTAVLPVPGTDNTAAAAALVPIGSLWYDTTAAPAPGNAQTVFVRKA